MDFFDLIKVSKQKSKALVYMLIISGSQNVNRLKVQSLRGKCILVKRPSVQCEISQEGKDSNISFFKVKTLIKRDKENLLMIKAGKVFPA